MIRPLLIAEAANPDWTSVPLVGWSHASAIGMLTQAHLVTQIRNRTAIEQLQSVPFVTITYIDSEAVARPLWRVSQVLRAGRSKGWTAATAINTLSYYYFEHLLWKQLGPAIRNGTYDVVHRITPLSPTTPSLLATRCRQCGIPFVVGPLNGGLPWPPGFTRSRWKEHEWLSYFRKCHRLLPGFAATRRDASVIVVGSRNTQSQVAAKLHHKCVFIPENGIDADRFPPTDSRPPRNPMQVVFVGRLVPYKCADLALRGCLPYLKDGRLELTIVGDGPERSKLERLANAESVSAAVRFLGWVPHEQVRNHLVDSDLFLFPSVREFGGAVVLEAMACGSVPMIVAYGGPAELASVDTAYFIELADRETMVRHISNLLSHALSNPVEVRTKADSGLQRIADYFTWEQKARQMIKVYQSAMQSTGSSSKCPSPFDDATGLNDPPTQTRRMHRASV